MILRVRPLFNSSVLLSKSQRTRLQGLVVQIQNEHETPEIKSCSNKILFVIECRDDDLLILNFDLIARFPSNV
jgi:hypothetical protein